MRSTSIHTLVFLGDPGTCQTLCHQPKFVSVVKKLQFLYFFSVYRSIRVCQWLTMRSFATISLVNCKFAGFLLVNHESSCVSFLENTNGWLIQVEQLQFLFSGVMLGSEVPKFYVSNTFVYWTLGWLIEKV